MRREAVVCCLPCKLFSVDRGTEALLEQRDCRVGYIDKAGEHILDMRKVLGSPMNTAERKKMMPSRLHLLAQVVQTCGAAGQRIRSLRQVRKAGNRLHTQTQIDLKQRR